MRFLKTLVILLLVASPAIAAPQESALVIRAGDLMAQPFIDAAKIGPVAADQPVVIVERRGGWANVQANGRTGWLRVLNLRMAPGTSMVAGRSSRPVAQLRTGSSGRTVTTGVKGLDDEDIGKAQFDPEQLARLSALALPESAARDAAARKRLTENKLNYLKPGKVK